MRPESKKKHFNKKKKVGGFLKEHRCQPEGALMAKWNNINSQNKIYVSPF